FDQRNGVIMVRALMKGLTAILLLALAQLLAHAQSGMLDPNFRAPGELLDANRKFVVLPTGKLLVSGDMKMVNGSPRLLLLLNSDGTPDLGFVPPIFNPGAGSIIPETALPNGKVLLRGNFSTYNRYPVAGHAWILPDFTRDNTGPGLQTTIFPYID